MCLAPHCIRTLLEPRKNELVELWLAVQVTLGEVDAGRGVSQTHPRCQLTLRGGAGLLTLQRHVQQVVQHKARHDVDGHCPVGPRHLSTCDSWNLVAFPKRTTHDSTNEPNGQQCTFATCLLGALCVCNWSRKDASLPYLSDHSLARRISQRSDHQAARKRITRIRTETVPSLERLILGWWEEQQEVRQSRYE